MIKDSLDNYTQNIMNHGIQEVIKDHLRNSIKNILDKYEEDYLKLRRDNENQDMDIESEVYYDSDGLYELYTRHWFKCVLSLADLIINIDLS